MGTIMLCFDNSKTHVVKCY